MIGGDPKVEVFGESRLGVFHHRVTADDKESNLMLSEKIQQF